jgi:hypothetical protein
MNTQKKNASVICGEETDWRIDYLKYVYLIYNNKLIYGTQQ